MPEPSSARSRKVSDSGNAFTLLELLIVVAVVSVLATLSFAGLSSVQESGLRAREISTSRTLATAYLQYAVDHSGELMPGYQYGSDSITTPDGTEITGEEVNRYPWRLAEYIEWNVQEVYLINRTKKEVAGLDPGSTAYRYMVALAPAMGLNTYCVGGNYASGGLLCPNDVVTRLSQVQAANVQRSTLRLGRLIHNGLLI